MEPQTVTADSLFELLDLNKDGSISRSELHEAANSLGWHWREAPLFALLDLLSISEPIPRNKFIDYLLQMTNDPMGPYGKVLLNADYSSATFLSESDRHISEKFAPSECPQDGSRQVSQVSNHEKNLIRTLQKSAGADTANGYHNMLAANDTCRISTDDAALLIIDPQRSFTAGVWMQSIGTEAATDVEPIVQAFMKCAKIVNDIYAKAEIMFTRCPFPPGSYDWDERLAGIIDSKQRYFIKPGNSVLFPPFNGFNDWLEQCIGAGKRILVIGGCTLNSCVRVSSIEILNHFKSQNLQIIVDLSLCGARSRNFRPSPLYDGESAVQSAVSQMKAAGVQVARRIEWY